MSTPQVGNLMKKANESTGYYEVVQVHPDGSSCLVWHHGPIVPVTRSADGSWNFEGEPVSFYTPTDR